VPRCDVFLRQGDRLRLAVSIDGGELDESRIGDSWALDDWLPESGAPDTLSAAAFGAGGGHKGQQARRALQRRGCRSLVWAPLTVRGEFIGAVEVSDARVRDLTTQVPVVAGLARFCAHALDIDATYHTLEHRDKAIRELVDLSQEVAQTHELSRFVERFALRLMAAVNADCVDVYRVGGGVIRSLISLSREGVEDARYDTILDTAKYPVLEQTLIDQTPLVIDSLSDPRLTPAEVEMYRARGYASSLTMPLVAGGAMVGLVDLYDDAERDWGLEVEFLTGVMQLVAGLFDNAVLLSEAEDRNRLQHELVELVGCLASAGSPREIAFEAARKLREVTGADDCDVWWLEEGYLRCLVSMDSRGSDEAALGKTLRLDHSPSTARMLEDGEVLVCATLDNPRITDDEHKDLDAFGFHSMISLPLIARDEVVGMIDVFDTVERDYNDVRGFLTSAARTIADALQSAYLMGSLRQSNAALRELVELGDRFSEAEGLQQLARIVGGRLRDILEAEDCDIWGIEGGRLHCLASIDSRGWDADEVGSERDLLVYEATIAALAANEPLVIGDLEAASLPEEEMAAYRRWSYRSMVSLPLVVEGRPIGLIDIFDTKVRDFTSMLDLIRNVGRLLAGALEKAMLVERLESGNRDLRLLVDSGLEFGATLDVEAVLSAVAERIVTVSAADLCDVYGLAGDDVEILVSLGSGVGAAAVGRRYARDEFSTFIEAAATRRPVVRLDVLNDPDVLEGDREDARRRGYESIMTIPFLAGGELIGFVEICNGEKGPFARPDVIIGLAQVAGQAVANARLYRELDESARRMTLMSESALELAGSLDLRDTLVATAKRLCDSVGVPECEITVIEGDGLRTLMRITLGHVDESWIGEYLPLADAAVTREVIETKRPTVVGSLHDPRLTAKVQEIDQDSPRKSWATLPLIVKDRVIGTVELIESSVERTFTQTELDTAAAICHAAAMAIKNAQLYEEIKQMHLGNLKALSSALNAKDYYTLGHASRVAAYTVMLGRRLGWEEDLLTSLEEAAYLHDIGKISISDRVLLKPGRLNPQEWQQMRLHPVFSADIIRPLFSEALVEGVRHHHEHYDGRGYPDGLAGDAIPMLARAMAVVDAYDAMSCRRPYKAALTYPECLAELQRCRGTQFEPVMVDAFLEVLEELAHRRAQAEDVAAQAASRIPGDKHLALRSREDEDTPEYREIREILREVRDANPPTRFLTTHAELDKKFVIGVDPEEQESERSHVGDEIFADDELPEVLAGRRPQVNTLFADEFGVWVTGLAAVRDAKGHIVAAVAADLPALSRAESEALRGDSRQTFAAMLHTAAARLGRAEIDAITDALTGLYNHRYLHERLSEELQRARELGRPLTALFCDLDHFKGYNDANGHSAGDAVLREVAHLIEQSVRNVDIAARFGGEEFVVLLVETGREAALAVAERIRERIHAAGFSAHGTPLTVSIGIAAYPEDADRREALLDKADWAMYLAKRRGRDQVATFAEG
jgi:diguanylate cyclase (GGDEF)-like protein